MPEARRTDPDALLRAAADNGRGMLNDTAVKYSLASGPVLTSGALGRGEVVLSAADAAPVDRLPRVKTEADA